jgi:formate hydrogenlyase transcriptional activator
MYPLYVPAVNLDEMRRNALLGIADIVCLRHARGQLLGDVSALLKSVFVVDLLNFAVPGPLHKSMEIELWVQFHKLFGPVEISVEDSIVGAVWRDQTPIHIDHVVGGEGFESELQLLREFGVKSYCAVPLTNSRKKLGALGVACKVPHSFRDEDINFLRTAAEMIAVAADSALADTDVSAAINGLRLLLELTFPDAQSPDLRRLIGQLVRSIQKWAVEDMVGIYIYDQKTGSLKLEMSNQELTGRMAPLPDGFTPLEGTLAGQVFRGRQALILDYSTLAGLPFDSVKRGMELGVRSLYLCPLVAAGQTLGVLKIARRHEFGFAPTEVEFMAHIASRIGRILGEAITHMPHNAVESFASAAYANPRQRIDFETGSDSPTASTFSAAEALMGSSDLLTAYFRASGVGFCILDLEFRFQAVNEVLAAIDGLPANEHIGKSLREVLGDFAELVEPYLLGVIATGQPIADLEVSCVLARRSDAGHWILHYVPIKDQAGKVAQIGAVVIEVTEQKRLAASLSSVSENLRQEKKRRDVLTEVSRALATNRDVKEVFPQVSAKLRRLLRQEYAALAVRQENSERLVPKALDFPLGKSRNVSSEIGASSAGGKALQKRLPLIFGREEVEALDPGLAAVLSSEGLKSLCYVPLLRMKKTVGLLVLGSTRADAFRTDDLALLDQVAAQLAVALENSRVVREVEQLKQRLKQEKRYLEVGYERHFEGIVGEAAALREVLAQVAVIAATDATVLLLGETGTGKGLVAQAVHRTSNRNGKAFVNLNCAAIPTGLLESELFGHEKGAFTGAVSQKIGRLEMAHGGTLFLDEIGEIPLELQPKLLRVLQDREFERLGGTHTIHTDFRLIAATNRDLTRSVAQKHFRSDLFYRLNVFPIRLPSLRERREDIPLLVRYFVQKYSNVLDRTVETIPTEIMDALTQWSWPGNVRELENFIERSVILTEGPALYAPLEEFQTEISGSSDLSLEQTEREHIIRVLRESGGMISGPTGAARHLGLKRTTLQSKMHRLGITREDYSQSRPQ